VLFYYDLEIFSLNFVIQLSPYSSILSYASQGTFIYEKYESLPPGRIEAIRRIMLSFIQRNDLLAKPLHPASRFVQEKFPQYFEEALADRNRSDRF